MLHRIRIGQMTENQYYGKFHCSPMKLEKADRENS